MVNLFIELSMCERTQGQGCWKDLGPEIHPQFLQTKQTVCTANAPRNNWIQKTWQGCRELQAWG